MTTNGPITGESAPSRLHADEPMLARYAGGIGWGLVVVGMVMVLANRMAETPRFFSESFGWLVIALGITAALVHAAVETDLLLRRILGGLGAALIFVGIGWGTAMAFKERSWALGLLPSLPGLFLVALHARKEEDQTVRTIVLRLLGGTGLLLCLVGVLGTAIAPQWMPARFSVALALGPILMLIFLGLSGVADDVAYWMAIALGALGALTFLGALQRAVRPELIHEWRDLRESTHLIAGAAGLSLLILGLIAMFMLGKPAEGSAETDANRSMKKWGRLGALTGAFLVLLGVIRYFAPGILASTGWGVDAPRPYLVPTGFTLMAAGLVYCLIAVGFVSENRLVVLTRRELTAYFVSPIAYCVMFGFVLMAAQAYFLFLRPLLALAEQQQPLDEPIVQFYVISFLQVVAVMVAVALLTMRLCAEEKRTGTLEVLLTAPVNDWVIVLSKFFASWLFFLLLWAPWWLFLLALRLEGGQEFDFRPMIGFMLTLVACGAAFMAMGIFFSSLTRDQIISAVLTFMGMALLVGCFFIHREIKGADGVSVAVKAVMRALSFIHIWIEATEGKVYIRDIVCQLCVAIFWLFATVKVLEVRRWS